MIPETFPEQTGVFKADPNEPNQMDTPYVHLDNCMVICLKLTDKEMEEIEDNGRVWLAFSGNTMPHIYATTRNPIARITDFDFPEIIDDGSEDFS